MCCKVVFAALVAVAATVMVYVFGDCAKKPPEPHPVSPTITALPKRTKRTLKNVPGALASFERMGLPLKSGSRHIAALIGSSGLLAGDVRGASSAVSDAVLSVRVKDVAALPEGIVAGVKTAVAPGGNPVAVSVIAGITLSPCGCNANVKLAVCPELTNSVVAPVAMRVKSVMAGEVTVSTKTLLVTGALRASPP